MLSLKEEFNARQWTQIESLFNIPVLPNTLAVCPRHPSCYCTFLQIKEEIKRRKERIQLEKELAENRKKEKEEEERQKKQAKAIKDEALSKEDDEV